VLLFVQRASQQILQKERAQGLDRREAESAARKRESVERAGSRSRPNSATKASAKARKSFVEGFKGAFPTDRIPQEHGHKVENFIATETPPGKAHLLGNG
jgi:hypothetical protein